MKNLKIALFGLLVVAVATLGTSFSASAQTTKFATYQGSTFTNGTTTSSLINGLATLSNWSSLSTTDPGFSGSSDLAAIQIDIAAGDPSPDFDQTSLQNFYTALKNYYINNGNVFPTPPTTFNISAVVNGSSRTYTITIELQ